MLQSASPLTLFRQQIDTLRRHLPGVLDGRTENIHDARIATRRIRELLPLTYEWQHLDAPDELAARFKQMGRLLGRVRDADVGIELLKYLESRIARAAPSLVLVRQRHDGERLHMMRRLVKRFERLDVERQLGVLAAGASRPRGRLWASLGSSWRNRMRPQLAERAQEAHEAITRATGVYFPNRTHQARIAIKKLRYAAEIAARTGLTTDLALIRELKKAQDILGDLHDRQTLIDELGDGLEKNSDQALASADGIDQAQLRLVAQVAQAEIDDLYSRFLARRPQVLDACQRAPRALDRSAITKGACAVAGVVALAAGIEATRRRQMARHAAAGPEAVAAVSVRVPVALPDMQSR